MMAGNTALDGINDSVLESSHHPSLCRLRPGLEKFGVPWAGLLVTFIGH